MKTKEKSPFRPMPTQIIVMPEKEPEKIGSIIVPEQLRTETNFGTIVAVGAGVARGKAKLKAGQRVVFAAYSGRDVEAGGVKVKFLSEGDVLGWAQ